MFVKTENKDLIRDTESLALLNINKGAVNKDLLYKQKMKKEKEIDATINSLHEEIADLRSDISKILELLASRGN